MDQTITFTCSRKHIGGWRRWLKIGGKEGEILSYSFIIASFHPTWIIVVWMLGYNCPILCARVWIVHLNIKEWLSVKYLFVVLFWERIYLFGVYVDCSLVHMGCFSSQVFLVDDKSPLLTFCLHGNFWLCTKFFTCHSTDSRIIRQQYDNLLWYYNIRHIVDISLGIEFAMFFIVFLYFSETKFLLLFQICSFPKTNVLWLVYLVDILLTKKSFVSLVYF